MDVGAFDVEEELRREFSGHDEDDQDAGEDEGENERGEHEPFDAVALADDNFLVS
jgi:hypothetical protein